MTTPPPTIFATSAATAATLPTTTSRSTTTTRPRAWRSGRSVTPTKTRAVKLPADAPRIKALLSTGLSDASAVVVFMAATAMPAMAEEAVSASAEISPFAGVVDVSVLALLAYFAKLGNEKAAREAQGKTKTGRSTKRK
jgi:hypothetical protein